MVGLTSVRRRYIAHGIVALTTVSFVLLAPQPSAHAAHVCGSVYTEASSVYLPIGYSTFGLSIPRPSYSLGATIGFHPSDYPNEQDQWSYGFNTYSTYYYFVFDYYKNAHPGNATYLVNYC